jgi:hypothetical protein
MKGAMGQRGVGITKRVHRRMPTDGCCVNELTECKARDTKPPARVPGKIIKNTPKKTVVADKGLISKKSSKYF